MLFLSPLPAFQIALECQAESGPKLVDWKRVLGEKFGPEVAALKNEVEEYASQFVMPGLEHL